MPEQLQLISGQTRINLLAEGNQNNPPVIMLHGLRDTAWSLLPVARKLAAPTQTHAGYRVYIMELRGHGASDRSEGYSMPNFLADLYRAVEAYGHQHCALFGHSLGGHLVTKFAALFPEQVQTLLLIEGMGPPRRPHEGHEVAEVQAYREMLLARLIRREKRSRPISSIEEVRQKLLKNNPRMSDILAAEIAPHLTRTVDGELAWAFDPAASSVFIGGGDNERFWKNVTAPTCIVSGTLSYEYWGRELPDAIFTGRFAEGEMEQRVSQFNNAEHHWFDQSGHMVHYDEPERLAKLCRTFLEKYYD